MNQRKPIGTFKPKARCRSVDFRPPANAEERLDRFLKPVSYFDEKPSSLYRYNSFQFLQSLRDFRNETKLCGYLRMSKELIDDFVRMKVDQFDSGFHQVNQPDTGSQPEVAVRKKTPSSVVMKKKPVRPKSATTSRRYVRVLPSARPAKSSSNNRDTLYSDGEDHCEASKANNPLEPFFHKSLDKISSIANWERQIRYEFEIEKELQRRELERQKEKLHSDQRKLEEWDKQLRIELDGRERKLRLSEEQVRSRCEEFEQKSSELLRREQMINEIVNDRIKSEMKFEIEKLKKKFNELEVEKLNLSRKEERVKEVEARLHEQVKIVKEKIDGKRMGDIELAKYRKELEILKKENEVLKEKVDSMEDYQVNKYENRALKSELQVVRETLESKCQELERDRERWEKEQRSMDQKLLSAKAEARKAEQELVIQKQRAQSDLEEMSSKYEAVNGQVKRMQTFIKNHLAKMNDDFSTTAHSLNQHFHQSFSKPGQYQHHRHQSMYQMRSGRSNRYNHQRSVSMDGNDYGRSRVGNRSRGCHLCDDEETVDDDYNNNHHNGLEESGQPDNRRSPFTIEEELTTNQDEVVRKIVDKIYEKVSHQINQANHSDLYKNGVALHEESFLETSQHNAEEVVHGSKSPTITVLESVKPTLDTVQHRSLYEELLLADGDSGPGPMVASPPKQAQPSLGAKQDSNNNTIKRDQPAPAVVVAATNQPNSSSSQSESFEIDW